MRRKFVLSIPFLLLAILVFTFAPPPKPVAGDEPLPPEVARIRVSGKGFPRPVRFPVPVDGGEIFFHADGCITVRHKGKILADRIECVDPDSLPQREVSVCAGDTRTSQTWSGTLPLEPGSHPYQVNLYNYDNNYGVSTHIVPGPLNRGNGWDGGAVTSVFVAGDECSGGAGYWYIEVGFSYNIGCDCWGIFYATNYWPDGNPDTQYLAYVGPANETDWHTLKAYRDWEDINGYNVWIDGHVFTKLPLPGGNPSDTLIIGTHHNMTNDQLTSSLTQYVYRYQQPGGQWRVLADYDWYVCYYPPGEPRYTADWRGLGHFLLHGPTWESCLH